MKSWKSVLHVFSNKVKSKEKNAIIENNEIISDNDDIKGMVMQII